MSASAYIRLLVFEEAGHLAERIRMIRGEKELPLGVPRSSASELRELMDPRGRYGTDSVLKSRVV